jgi:hypothetical protein
MMRLPTLLLWPALLLALIAPATIVTADETEEGPKNPEFTWYAQALARGGAGLNVTHFWSRGSRLRSETVVAGHKVVTIVNGPWYYAYDGLTGTGLAIKREAGALANDRPDRRPFGNEYDLLMDQGAELVREEDMVGRKAGVFRVTDDLGRREIWTTLDELHLPLRIEIYDRKSAQRRYTDYLNWQSGLAVPLGFFEPPPNITLERIEFLDYLKRTRAKGTVGPVPILYSNLLHVRADN